MAVLNFVPDLGWESRMICTANLLCCTFPWWAFLVHFFLDPCVQFLRGLDERVVAAEEASSNIMGTVQI